MGLTTPFEQQRAEYNSKLWNSSSEENGPERTQARKQKRKLSFISNIYVVKDPTNPENDGKVFRFRYGKKIWDKINDMAKPQFEDEEAVDVFDFWEGANFRLKIRNFEGYRNYDKSEFDRPSALLDDDEEMEKIWKQQYSLQELIDPSNFKSYDELKARLNDVLGLDGDTGPAQPRADEPEQAAAPAKKTAEAPTPKASPAPSQDSDDDDDDELAVFKNLLNNDD